jgi:cysteine-rich repeat protein
MQVGLYASSGRRGWARWAWGNSIIGLAVTIAAAPVFAATATPTRTPTRTSTATATNTATPTPNFCPGNLLSNPSFELHTGATNSIGDPIPTVWLLESGEDGSTTGFHPPDGSWVGYVWGIAANNTGRMTQQVSAVAGNIFTMTFYSGTHDPTVQPTIEIRFYNASNTEIGTPAIHTITTDIDVTGSLGGPYTLSATAPAGVSYLKVIFRDPSASRAGAKGDALCLKATVPTATATRTFTSTGTATQTVTATITNTPIPTATTTQTPTATRTATSTPANTSTSSATATQSATATATHTGTATVTATAVNTATVTQSATATITNTAIPSATATRTATATSTPPNTATATGTATGTGTATFTATAVDTATVTATASTTPVSTATATHTGVPTSTPENTATATGTASQTATPTATASATQTATASATGTATGTDTPTITVTPADTPTETVTVTPTSSVTATPVDTATATPHDTGTATETATASPSTTSTGTATPSDTATSTPPSTASATATNTALSTATRTGTATATGTPTATPTPFCGDGHVDPGESCDDGNATAGDGCESDCTVTVACTLVYPGTQRYVGNCGTPAYADIQAAIDAATDGDRIAICPGTYTDPVVVTKQVQLEPATAGTVTIHTTGTTFDIRRSGVEIDGLTIHADNGAAITADAICPLGTPTCGQPSAGSHLTIAGNTIVNSPNGILWHREIDCVRIVRNALSDDANPIRIEQQEGAPATQVTIDENILTGGGQGGAAIALSGLGVTVSANTVQNSATAGITLANVPGAGATQVIENTIDHSAGDGVTIKPGASGALVQYNNITHNGVGLGNESGAGTLDATLNWWASQSGPSGLFTGHGDSIVNRVNGTTTQFIEFLCKPFPGGFPSVLGVCSTEVAELSQLVPGRAPDLSTLGRYIVFESTADIDVDPRTAIANADGSQEVFLLNRKPKKSLTGVCLGGVHSCDFSNIPGCTPCKTFKQCPGDPGADPIVLAGQCVVITQMSDGAAPQTSAKPRLSRLAKTVVYASDDDQLRDNGDGSMEVRNWTRRTFEKNLPPLQSLTNGAAGIVYDNPVPSLDGKYVVVESNADPIGQNSDGNVEIFALQTKRNQWIQITHTLPPVANHRPTTITGHRILFDSDGDLTGHNADGNRELFLARLKGSGAVQLSQITDTTVSAIGEPVENRSGDLDGHSAVVAFSSNGDFVGRNPEGNREIFTWYRPTGGFEQLTVSPSGDNANPVVNQSQRFVVFESTADLTSSGATNRRIFQLDRQTGKLTLLSRSRVGTNQAPRIVRRRFVVWESNANLTGKNPNGDWVIYLFDRKKD